MNTDTTVCCTYLYLIHWCSKWRGKQMNWGKLFPASDPRWFQPAIIPLLVAHSSQSISELLRLHFTPPFPVSQQFMVCVSTLLVVHRPKIQPLKPRLIWTSTENWIQLIFCLPNSILQSADKQFNVRSRTETISLDDEISWSSVAKISGSSRRRM